MLILTQHDIKTRFPFWVSPYFYDETYAVPSRDWLVNKFYPWFRDVRWAENRNKWTPKNDCDNFARRFVVECQDRHADSKPDITAQGLAVGEFCFVRRDGTAHAIVVAVTEFPGLTFIEPQTGQLLSLTQQEENSCFRVSF